MGMRGTMAARRAALAGTLALGGTFTLGDAGPAAAATVQIRSCPYAITAPGTYVLAANLICPGIVAIGVTANNVRLILGSRTLDGGGGSRFGVVAEGVTGLSVVGGTITGFSVVGINLSSTPGARVVGVNVSGNGGYGFLLSSCAGCEFVGNRASRNGVDGISAFTQSPDLLVVGNTTVGNGRNGIGLGADSTGDRLIGNLATGNGQTDLFDGNIPSCVNTWLGNRFATDNETGAAAGPGQGCIR